jgi:hypothetical protein
MPSVIPDHQHFVWFGRSFPWFASLAVESALRANPGGRATLWASDAIESDPVIASLLRRDRFELRRLAPEALLAELPGSVPTALLAQLLRDLKSPTALANIARLLILAAHGGVYLDTDTLSLRDLTPLRELGAFCGLEHAIWPFTQRYRWNTFSLVGGPALEVIRAVLARVPNGERGFRHVSQLYYQSANNAVLGFAPAHPFLLRTLEMVARIPPEQRAKRYRLGTHLTQQALAAFGQELGVHALPPAAFYPLGPELSRQYFRERSDAVTAAAKLIGPDTYVLHWYASVSKLAPYDRARVERERERTMFAALSSRVLE